METNYMPNRIDSDIYSFLKTHSGENEWAIDTRIHVDKPCNAEKKSCRLQNV